MSKPDFTKLEAITKEVLRKAFGDLDKALADEFGAIGARRRALFGDSFMDKPREPWTHSAVPEHPVFQNPTHPLHHQYNQLFEQMQNEPNEDSLSAEGDHHFRQILGDLENHQGSMSAESKKTHEQLKEKYDSQGNSPGDHWHVRKIVKDVAP
jgi:hypothetical protein